MEAVVVIGLDVMGAGSRVDTSQNIYDSNPVIPDPKAPAPTFAVSYYPEAPGFVENPRKIDVNRDFGMNRYVPRWDTTESDGMIGIDVFVTGAAKSDPTVAAVQSALVKKGYSVGKSGVDGVMGKDTRAAIRKYQKASGLPVTGLIDDALLKALVGAAAEFSDRGEDVVEARKEVVAKVKEVQKEVERAAEAKVAAKTPEDQRAAQAAADAAKKRAEDLAREATREEEVPEVQRAAAVVQRLAVAASDAKTPEAAAQVQVQVALAKDAVKAAEPTLGERWRALPTWKKVVAGGLGAVAFLAIGKLAVGLFSRGSATAAISPPSPPPALPG